MNKGKRDTTQSAEEALGLAGEFTPDKITKYNLPANGVFVFGSNDRGVHGKGAAKTAVDEFGAIIGQATGLQGKSFAIRTKMYEGNKLTEYNDLTEISKKTMDSMTAKDLNNLRLEALNNPDKKYYVTEIGTKLAGRTVEQMKNFFIEMQNEFGIPDNIILPEVFEVRNELGNVAPIVEESTGTIKTVSEDYGVVQVETNPTIEDTKEVINLIAPQIEKQAYKENIGENSNWQFSFGKMWSRVNLKAKPLLVNSFAGVNKVKQQIEDLKKEGKLVDKKKFIYDYHELDQDGNPLPSLSTLQPLIDEIQNSLGIDMSNYDSVLGNIYLDNQTIQPHKDTTESRSAQGYPVVVYTIGNNSSLGIWDDNQGKITFQESYKEDYSGRKPTNEVTTKNGTVYTFGMDGKGRFALTHTTPLGNIKKEPFPPIKLSDGRVITNYTITLTFRRAGDLEQGMPEKPAVINTESAAPVVDEKRPVFNMLPSKSATKTMTYAGIGSRETPQAVLDQMTEASKYLDSIGYTLQTGFTYKDKVTGLDEEGADKAFSDGTQNKILFGPSGIRKTVKGATTLEKYDESVTEKSNAIVEEIHPAPERLTPGAIKLMARNTNQIFGQDLNSAVDFILFYAQETPGSIRPKGGTGQAVEMARRKGISTINMADTDWKNQLQAIIGNKTPVQPTVKTVAERTISYTPKGKETQTYTIKGSKIFNKTGNEVFKTDSADRNKIFANLAVKEKRAVVVNYKKLEDDKAEKYIVNDKNVIISVTTGKVMNWPENNGKRLSIIESAKDKFNKKQSAEVEEVTKSDLSYEDTSKKQPSQLQLELELDDTPADFDDDTGMIFKSKYFGRKKKQNDLPDIPDTTDC